MKIVALSLFLPNYSDLAQKTLYKNRDAYCSKHGYDFLIWAMGPQVGNRYEIACRLGFDKIRSILYVFRVLESTDYVWFADCDGLVMNSDIRIEQLVEKYPKPIITGSDKAGISCGSLIVRNSTGAKDYLNNLLDQRAEYEREQDYFWKNRSPFVVSTPQRVMNSYDCVARLESKDDPGNYQSGDFFLHLTGLTLEQRLIAVEKWEKEVK